MSFCPQCGYQVGESSKFCPECGENLSTPAKSIQSEVVEINCTCPKNYSPYLDEMGYWRCDNYRRLLLGLNLEWRKHFPAQKIAIT
jgi:zinc-ribbon domain